MVDFLLDQPDIRLGDELLYAVREQNITILDMLLCWKEWWVFNKIIRFSALPKFMTDSSIYKTKDNDDEMLKHESEM